MCNHNNAYLTEMGNHNNAHLSEMGNHNNAYLSEMGNHNNAYLTEMGNHNNAHLSDMCNHNNAYLSEMGNHNNAYLAEMGNHNSAYLTKMGNIPEGKAGEEDEDDVQRRFALCSSSSFASSCRRSMTANWPSSLVRRRRTRRARDSRRPSLAAVARILSRRASMAVRQEEASEFWKRAPGLYGYLNRPLRMMTTCMCG
jgi:hypothetical protein